MRPQLSRRECRGDDPLVLLRRPQALQAKQTEAIVDKLRARVPESNATYNSVAKLSPKPYPDHRAILNAYELCCMKDPKAKELSPMALWDLHYLRELDDSGFIDRLYGE